jgi:hypothetical protein
MKIHSSSLASAVIAIICLAVIAEADGQQMRSPGQQQMQRSNQGSSSTAPKLFSTPSSHQMMAQQQPVVSPPASAGRTFVPSHLRNSGVQQVSYSNSRFANQEYYEGDVIMGESIVDDGGGGCADGSCGLGGCSDCYDDSCGGCGYGDGCDPCGYARYPSLISCSDMEFFGGAQGFKGSANLGEGGSFGFHEGINFGFPFPLFQGMGLSGQIGGRFVHSNGNGAGFTTDTRQQVFVTGGLFRRVDYGLQGGAVVDYLSEDWYYKGTYAQLRAEISFVGVYGNQFGFRYTGDLDEEPGIGPVAKSFVPAVGDFNTFVPLDTYRFFYQQKLAYSNSIVEFHGGFSGQSQGLMGADAWVPLTERILLRTSGTLLIDDSEGVDANIDEAWNVSVSAVFYPKGWNLWQKAYHRPMFDVADNGSFLIGRQ